MSSGNKLPEAEKFIKKRKRMKLWYRLLVLASSIVVFITTYMLILPAITAEFCSISVYDRALSSGGAEYEEGKNMSPSDEIIETTTDTLEMPTETATETETSDSDLNSGSGEDYDSNSDGTLSDGAKVEVTLDKIEDKDNEEGLLDKVVNTLASLTGGATINAKPNGTDNVCIYNPETGVYNVNLAMDFVIPQDALTTDFTRFEDTGLVDVDVYQRAYRISLPKDIIVPDNMVTEEGSTHIFDGIQTGTSINAFLFYYEPIYEDDGETVKNYDLVMVYKEDFLNNTLHGGDDIEGTVTLDGEIKELAYNDKTGDLEINEGGFEIIIPPGIITYPNNSTVNKNIQIIKKGKYDEKNKTITYTLYVTTKKGTGDLITINDALKDTKFLEDLGVTELESITLHQGILEVPQYGGTNFYGEENMVPVEFTNGTGINNYTVSIENGKLGVKLDGLESVPKDKENIVNAYKITYTFKVDPKPSTKYSGENTAVVTTKDEINNKVLKDESTTYVNISSKKIIDKVGKYDEASNKITWTITVGDGENSLKDFILSDKAFDDFEIDKLKGFIFIKDSKGNLTSAVEGVDYEITADGNKIKFLSEEAKQYVIEYETDAKPSYGSQSITNEADITGNDGKESYSYSSTVNIGGYGDCFTKSLVNHNIEDGIGTANWNTAFNLPDDGIPIGVTFTDELTYDGHYMTSDQIRETVKNIKAAWGEENITDIEFKLVGFWENKWTGDIVDGTLYYGFRYKTAKNVIKTEDRTTISYNYCSTADISGAGNSKVYINTFRDSYGNYATAKWEYTKGIKKYAMDASGNIKDNKVSITLDPEESVAGKELTWFVEVNLEKQPTDDGSVNYVVKDTLPKGVTLTELSVGKDNKNTEFYTIESSIDQNPFKDRDNLTFNYSVSIDETTYQQVVTLNLKMNSPQTQKINYLWVKYKCKVSGDLQNGSTNSDGSVNYNITNNVEAYAEGSKIGSSDNTITVTEGSKATEESLDKELAYDKDNNRVDYRLEINPKGELYTYGDSDEYYDIELDDIVSFESHPDHGYVRNAELVNDSLKLYYAVTDSSGAGIRGEDGKLIKGRELTKGDYTWSYSTETTVGWSTSVKKILHFFIPNGTPIIFEYSYRVSIIKDSNYDPNFSWDSEKANVKNSAILKIKDQEISEEVKTDTGQEEYNSGGTTGQARGGSNYTIYKVDEYNFAYQLPDAKFDLYVFDKNTNEFVNKGSFKTNEAGQTGFNASAVKDEAGQKIVSYTINTPDGYPSGVPVNTMCYFLESQAPDGYAKTNKKYCFYFGENIATMASSCFGYNEISTDSNEAYNLITGHTEYIKNERSPDYLAEKTTFSVVKKWVDSAGTELKKEDGSIKFKLYQVLHIVDNPGVSGGDANESVKLNVTYGNEYSTFGTTEIKVNKSENASANIISTLKNSNYNEWWKPKIRIIDLNTGETLSDNIVSEWKNERIYNYNVSLIKGNRNIKVEGYENIYSANDYEVSLSSDNEYIETTTEENTETTTEGIKTRIYSRTFSEDDKRQEEIDGKMYDIGGIFTADEYFTISGNVSNEAGSAIYDVDRDGVIDKLNWCLKMENNSDKRPDALQDGSTKTTINFNAKKGGVLTLVFNNIGTNTINIDGSSYSAVNNRIIKYLEPGEHILERTSECYLFYIEFEEGASGGLGNSLSHNFNDSLDSVFYTITSADALAVDRGDLIYGNLRITQCLKMNYKANITFDNTDIGAGTYRMVFTNPDNAPVVGVIIDGRLHKATPTNRVDSLGNVVYSLTAYIEAGKHEVTRINNGYEVLLYYMDFTPLGGDGSEPIISDTPPDINQPNVNQYTGGADTDGTFTLSAEHDWRMVFSGMPWQHLDEYGNVLGYYKYFVVEEENKNYITTYVNSIQEGIATGTIEIRNEDISDTSTRITVIKNWLSMDGFPMEDAPEESIEFDLLAKVNIFNDFAGDYNVGKTEYRSFPTKEEDLSLNDGFFTCVYNNNNYPQSSSTSLMVEYNKNTYQNYIKLDSNSSITFTSPANEAKLTLLCSNYKASFENKDICFILKMPNGDKYRYVYTISEGTSTEEINRLVVELTRKGEKTGTVIYDSMDNKLNSRNYPKIELTNIPALTEKHGSATECVITLNEPGEYQIIHGNYDLKGYAKPSQGRVFYMQFDYNLEDLAEDQGIYIGSYKLTSSIIGSENWRKTISGIPLNLFNENGDKIGYYTYFVKETSPNKGYITTYEYQQMDNNDLLMGKNTKHFESSKQITAGVVNITNKKEDEGIVLPESGGNGVMGIMLTGLALWLGSGLLLYKRSKKLRNNAYK